jgi:hypothetical protein
MKLQEFVTENKDNDPAWKNLFSKSDIVFLDNANYEQFKRDLANYLFELRYGKQNFLDSIEAGCREEFIDNYEILFDALVNFLNTDNRPIFDLCEPDKFADAFEKYLILENIIDVDLKKIGQTTKKILLIMTEKLRSCFVKFEILPDEDEKAKDIREFTQMTGQIGEILVKLTFQHFRGCGELIETKIVLDNPNMPRHGEDFVGFAYHPEDENQDILYLVEAKSTKGSVGQQVLQVKERFTKYLLTGIPEYEINRLRETIQQKLGEHAVLPRKRISSLLWKTRREPNNKQVVAGAFFHFPSTYNPHKSTFLELGDIKVEKEDGTILKMDAERIHIITFKFNDFEQTIREIFERAWTI